MNYSSDKKKRKLASMESCLKLLLSEKKRKTKILRKNIKKITNYCTFNFLEKALKVFKFRYASLT